MGCAHQQTINKFMCRSSNEISVLALEQPKLWLNSIFLNSNKKFGTLSIFTELLRSKTHTKTIWINRYEIMRNRSVLISKDVLRRPVWMYPGSYQKKSKIELV